jgi:preprotein translocase subunit SecG
METFLLVIHVLAALFMILVILIQGGNQGGIGAAFGGGNSQGVFGATGATSFLGKVTYGIAGIFMVTSIGLSVVQGTSGDTGLTERLEQTATQPADDTKPGDATESSEAPQTKPDDQPEAEGTMTPKASTESEPTSPRADDTPQQ